MRIPVKRLLALSVMTACGACAALVPRTSAAAESPAAGGSAAITGEGIKWHPGNYVWLDPHASLNDQLRTIDSLGDEPSVTGIQLLVNWVHLEGAAAGDYSAGFAMVDSILARLAAQKRPKRLILGVNERSFGAPFPAGTSCEDAGERVLPRYIAKLADPGCAVADKGAAGSLAVMAKFWRPDIMDRLIALSDAYAARYDRHPLVEMFYGNGETAVAAPKSSGFSMDDYDDQLRRWFDAGEKAWTHTQTRALVNYFGGDSQMRHMLQYLAKKKNVAVGGPDPELPLPDVSRTIQANQIYRGQGGGPDFRNVLVWVGEVQGMGLGIKYTQKPAEILQYETKVMGASYMIWSQNNFTGGPEQRWTTGILPFLRSGGGTGLAESCPSHYARCLSD